MKIKVALTLDNTVDTQKTTATQVPEWCKAASVEVPQIADGAVTLEYLPASSATAATLAPTNDTGWLTVQAVVDSVGPAQAVLASGADPACADFTKLIRGLGDGYIRFSAAAQSGATTWYVNFSD